MADFRRWLRLGSPQLIVVAAAVVGSASGCHSLSEYLTDAGSVSSHRASSDWPAAQPLSAPYEAFPPQAPGGESIPLSPPSSLSPSSPVLPAPSSAEAALVPPPNESLETEVATQTSTDVGSGASKRAPQPELPMPDELPQSVVVGTPESSDPADAPGSAITGSAITGSAITGSAEPKRTVAAPTRADEPFGSNLFPDEGPLTDLTAASPLEAQTSPTKPDSVTPDSVTPDSTARQHRQWHLSRKHCWPGVEQARHSRRRPAVCRTE